MKDNLRSLLLLIHYWFPVALGWSIASVIHSATGLPILVPGLHLYLLGICAAYSLDRIVDNSDPARPLWVEAALVLAFVLSAVVGFFLAIRLPMQTFATLLLFSTITLFYYRAKRLPFVKGILVAVVWGWAGVALPFANGHWFAWQFWTMHISLPVVMLIACNVVLCDFKDIRTDHQNGVQSLPAMLGLRRTTLIISALLIVAAVISYQEQRLGLVISSGVLLLLTQFPRLLALDAVGPLIADASLVIPGLLIALHVIT
jgi:4-hydroxybenzoate polyprenyltransferase